MDTEQAVNILKYAWPILVLQISLQIYAFYDLYKKKKTRNLSVALWAAIIIIGQTLGAAAYLLIGRAEE